MRSKNKDLVLPLSSPSNALNADEKVEAAMQKLLKVSAKYKVSIASSSSIPTRNDSIMLMEHYLERLNLSVRVQKHLSVIHVAGTKGKGSTCAMTERILREEGFKTGLFTSPHLISPCERIRINGAPITPDLFLHHFESIWNRLNETADQSQGHPPIAWFFRFLTLLALQVFVDEKVDVAILEVGLGGRLDATNVIQQPVVCGITTLDFDHTQILGSTMDAIAYAKAGIFKPNVPAFTVGQQDQLALDTLYTCARDTKTPLYIVPSFDEFDHTSARKAVLGLKGSYQRVNAALAVTLASVWLKHHNGTKVAWTSNESIDYPSMLTSQVKKGLEAAFWPARSHTIHDSKEPNLTYHIDGGHTLQSLVCCAEWYKDSIQNGPCESPRRILVFSCHHERNIALLMAPLVALQFDSVYFCPTSASRPSDVEVPTFSQVLKTSGFESSIQHFTEEELHVRDRATGPLRWQHTTAAIWKELERLQGQKASHTRVMNSTKEFMELIRSTQNHELHNHVLFTGSLYLAGEVLRCLGWKEGYN
ncbi:unnamed protein product [Albugo candida]|uniref:tetrahydrofolate synthase n=1 Tax=Albugo candida TaxID=65357 RepID=A0A024GIR4_9STRA|nr:unnamed protein product [Albugo candida]|eukprot:CCI46783.1 unnamed protein product [Albugo candida]